MVGGYAVTCSRAEADTPESRMLLMVKLVVASETLVDCILLLLGNPTASLANARAMLYMLLASLIVAWP